MLQVGARFYDSGDDGTDESDCFDDDETVPDSHRDIHLGLQIVKSIDFKRGICYALKDGVKTKYENSYVLKKIRQLIDEEEDVKKSSIHDGDRSRKRKRCSNKS